MKIIFIITKADEIGGAQIHVRDIAFKMKKDKHYVKVIVGEHGALVNELHRADIKTYILPELVRNISPIKDLICIYKIRKIINTISPDIIALHSSKAGIIGRAALLFKRIPVTFTAHGWSFADGVDKKRKIFYILIEKIFSNFTNKIITVSQQDKDIAIKYKVADEKRQVVIHNGIPDFIGNKRRKNNNIINLVSIARFSEQKDHISLFKALSGIKNKRWHLDLIGKGPLLEEMIKLSKHLGISENVSFLGERGDINNLLSDQDIFLLISNWEGLPISIIEAMRQSLPVLASNVGGVSELVDDGTTGYLVQRKNSDEIKDKLELLMEDKTLRDFMGNNGRKKYKNQFTFNQMYNKTLSLYEKLIKEKV
ncbi:glycosyltransferase family 4 protein [Photorhabdus stackebrandtii]|uniref:Glycosyltransferase family 1 protein n=1 Tax=Photorhabdus stackebrandtii TaxID=1123042 RepID=A0A7X5QLJ7_9GAMM|nr:glycosyltransferase family 4 protein [Photorhabdus stackebrandtii]NHB96444.1 glycosyltransferase family 1 protein [Photorhabdus stackebrandtii]